LPNSKFLEGLSQKASKFTASSIGFGVALTLIVVWLVVGPFLHYSENWQFFFTTLTTIIPFLLIFLIQRAQNKDISALHLKLNELIASKRGASNRLLNVEEKTEDELAALRDLHEQLPKNTLESHSLEHASKPELILPPSVKQEKS
jgi:low affinity Fe/Cu permease